MKKQNDFTLTWTMSVSGPLQHWIKIAYYSPTGQLTNKFITNEAKFLQSIKRGNLYVFGSNPLIKHCHRRRVGILIDDIQKLD